MSYASLMNKTCSWYRTSSTGTVTEYAEEKLERTLIAEDQPCRLERLYDRELVEGDSEGDHNKGIFVLYLNKGANIRAGDAVIIDGDVPDFQHNTSGENNELIVLEPEDAGGGQGHHLELFCRYRKELE